MAEQMFDVLIIGGGPGGYVSAIRAAQLGFKTAVVEREHMGGICLNWGCIPTKAMLRSSDIYNNMKRAEEYGLSVEKIGFDITKIVSRSRKVSAQLSGGISHLMKKNKVEVLEGQGKLLGKGLVEVSKDGKEVAQVKATHIIIATGARARALPGMEPDGNLIWDYKHALTPKEMPKSMLVIGSGAIGVEFATFYNSMGVDVTVVEVADRIVPVEDAEISKAAEKEFKKHGMTILTSAKVVKLNKSKTNVEAEIEVKGKLKKIVVDKIISAVGVVPNSENLGLENTAIKTGKGGFIETNQWCETSEKGVYAIGDVSGAPCLAHKASHEGIICVEKIKGVPGVHSLDAKKIPGCTYSHPQIASVGYTEEQAKEAGYKVKIGRFSFRGNGKAIALGEPEGLVKTVFDEKTGELLGAHMIGAEVTEMIQGFGITQKLEGTEEDLMTTVFPHPTLSEMMHESTLDAYDKVIHM